MGGGGGWTSIINYFIIIIIIIIIIIKLLLYAAITLHELLLEAWDKRGAQLPFADHCITCVCVWRGEKTAGRWIDVHTLRAMSILRRLVTEHLVPPLITHAGLMLIN